MHLKYISLMCNVQHIKMFYRFVNISIRALRINEYNDKYQCVRRNIELMSESSILAIHTHKNVYRTKHLDKKKTGTNSNNDTY